MNANSIKFAFNGDGVMISLSAWGVIGTWLASIGTVGAVVVSLL